MNGITAVLTPNKVKENIREIMGDNWKTSVTGNSHFFHDKETREVKGLILDFKREGTREMWRKKLLERRGKVGLPFSVRNFGWYTDDTPSKISKRQEDLLKPGAVEALSTPRIFVGNLNKTTSAVDLVIYFSRFGPVKDATVMANTKTGKSRGFGFVTFKDIKTSDLVMSQYHSLMGKDLAIQKALGEEDIAIRGSAPDAQIRITDKTATKTLKVSPLPSGLDEAALRKYFRTFGQITGLTIKVESDGDEKGLRIGEQEEANLSATVSFASADAVEKAMQHVKHKIPVAGSENEERTIRVSKEFPQPHFASEKIKLSSPSENGAVDTVGAEPVAAESAEEQMELQMKTKTEEQGAANFLEDLSKLVKPAVPMEKPEIVLEDTSIAEPLPADYNIDPFGVKKNSNMVILEHFLLCLNLTTFFFSLGECDWLKSNMAVWQCLLPRLGRFRSCSILLLPTFSRLHLW